MLLFATVVTAANWGSALTIRIEIARVWYWVAILASGFGVQVGLYSYVRSSIRSRVLTAELATTGTVSTGSMLACCAHALAGLLPLLGLSAAAVLVARYQLPLILAGVISNAIGITVMFTVIGKHRLYENEGRMVTLARFNWKRVRGIAAVLGLAAISATSLAAWRDQPAHSDSALKTLSDERDGVEIVIKPRSLAPDEPFVVAVSFDTHVVELDFDIGGIAALSDDRGRSYRLVSQEGDPPGGHHRSVVLMFQPIRADARRIELVLRGIAGTDRVYAWELPRR